MFTVVSFRSVAYGGDYRPRVYPPCTPGVNHATGVKRSLRYTEMRRSDGMAQSTSPGLGPSKGKRWRVVLSSRTGGAVRFERQLARMKARTDAQLAELASRIDALTAGGGTGKDPRRAAGILADHLLWEQFDATPAEDRRREREAACIG
jgi:hypothetical protein